MLLLFSVLGTVGASSNSYIQNTTSKPFDIIQNHIVENQRGCEVLCDGMDTCAAFSFKEAGVESQCILLSTNVKNQICAEPQAIFLKREETSVPQETPVPEPTYIYEGLAVPQSFSCIDGRCSCSDGKYIFVNSTSNSDAISHYSGFVMMIPKNGIWRIFGKGTMYLSMGNKIVDVTCRPLSPWFGTEGCSLPPVLNGTYGNEAITCSHGFAKAATALGDCSDESVLSCRAGFTCDGAAANLFAVYCA